MEALIRHLVHPLVGHPDDVKIQELVGDAVTVYELSLHDDDQELFEDDGGRLIRSIRTVLSAGSGHQKSSLELVRAFSEPGAEE
jgi:predicted RNA-binding protein YlqC (UPF0109 family)